MEQVTRARILRDLQAPGVELRETHISLVLLADDVVWKIKKPVDYGFLDFSTLDKREAACRAEVELNRRLAADVYLGVIPVTQGEDGGLRFGGPGAALEWAVKMRRLPDRDRADVRLREGRLDRRHVERVAERIAEFHHTALSDSHTAEFGSPEKIGFNVRESFSQTRETVTDHISSDQAAEIEAWQTRFIDNNASTFVARADAGRVRDGHGDLRLEHVYIDDAGEIVVIDCIEFNERFRYADVASDIAFLAMDLSDHGHVELSECLVARYARESNDYDMYGVLDFYESYRAYVRAKISSILAADPDVDSETRTRGAEHARRHYLLALASEREPVIGPKVVAVGGVIASGKSTIADHLAFELSAPVVEADRTRKYMLGVEATRPVTDGAWQGAYSREFTQRVYAEVFRRASVVLASGRPVVIDASFRSRELRAAAKAVADRRGVPFRFVECQVDHDVCRARLEKRAKSASVSDGRLEIFDDFIARWEAVEELAADEHVVIDTGHPVSRNIEVVRELVALWPRGLVC